jgi:glycosidase
MLDQEMIFHHAQYPWLFIEKTLSCHIMIALPKDKVQRAIIKYGDPFDFLPETDKQPHLMQAGMILERTEGKQDFFVITVMPFTHKLRYHFQLETAEGIYWYAENGVQQSENEMLLRPFLIPYLYPKAQYCPPKWTGESVWYQIFPDRFFDSRQRNDPLSFVPDRTNFFGGDIRGIQKMLPYLQAMGVTGVYLTPVFQSTSNHRYDTQDYMRVDPSLGTEEDLNTLCGALHERSMKCMLDGVYNHAGWANAMWQDVLVRGEQSPYRDWFCIYNMKRTQTLSLDELTSDVMKREPPYEAFAFAANMPKWNTENKAVQEYLISSAEKWTKRLHIDGWRLDVPDEVSMDFWRSFRKRIKAVDPEIYITGEIWGSPVRWLAGDTFDGAMNYTLYFILRDFALLRLEDASGFTSRMNRYLLSTPAAVRKNMLNFAGNHDLPRMLSLAKGETNAVMGALLLLILQEGELCLYYGDEAAMPGGPDPDNRRPMIWQDNCVVMKMRNAIQSLLRLRKEFHGFKDGKQSFEALTPTIVKGKWQMDGCTLSAYVHNGSLTSSVPIQIKGEMLFGNGVFDGDMLALPPHGAALIREAT